MILTLETKHFDVTITISSVEGELDKSAPFMEIRQNQWVTAIQKNKKSDYSIRMNFKETVRIDSIVDTFNNLYEYVDYKRHLMWLDDHASF